MKRFAPALLAVLLGSGSVLALSQNADASPSNSDHHKLRPRLAHTEHKRRHELYEQNNCAIAVSILNCVSLSNFKR